MKKASSSSCCFMRMVTTRHFVLLFDLRPTQASPFDTKEAWGGGVEIPQKKKTNQFPLSGSALSQPHLGLAHVHGAILKEEADDAGAHPVAAVHGGLDEVRAERQHLPVDRVAPCDKQTQRSAVSFRPTSSRLHPVNLGRRLTLLQSPAYFTRGTREVRRQRGPSRVHQ